MVRNGKGHYEAPMLTLDDVEQAGVICASSNLEDLNDYPDGGNPLVF